MLCTFFSIEKSSGLHSFQDLLGGIHIAIGPMVVGLLNYIRKTKLYNICHLYTAITVFVKNVSANESHHSL